MNLRSEALTKLLNLGEGADSARWLRFAGSDLPAPPLSQFPGGKPPKSAKFLKRRLVPFS
jgi:hypothetical protein